MNEATRNRREKDTGKAREVSNEHGIRVQVGDPDWNLAEVEFSSDECHHCSQWGSRMRVLGWLLCLVGLLAIMVAARAIFVGDREMLTQVWEVVKAAIPLLVGWAIGTVGADGRPRHR